MQKYVVEGHKESLLPENKNWKLVWNDEFDGDTLDETKWDFRLHMAGKRHKCWIEDAVSFEDSNIIFHLVEKDGVYYSSALQTGENYTDRPNGESRNVKQKFTHKYGYLTRLEALIVDKAPYAANNIRFIVLICSN